jgi:hypothetical protein
MGVIQRLYCPGVTAFSGGNKWVGITLHAPPPFPTLMKLAMSRDLKKEVAGLREQDLRPSVTDVAAGPESQAAMRSWAVLLGSLMGEIALQELEQLKVANKHALRDLNAASTERRRATRSLRKLTGMGVIAGAEVDAVRVRLAESSRAYGTAQTETRRITRRIANLVYPAAEQLRGPAMPGDS